LDERHPKKYKVFNVSEKVYESARFDDRVANYNWQDHHAPPFHILIPLVEEMYQWLL
jgi:phosphatidylinositol-3,4,5-trisphosphate 3-phosphatase and dual-specificity protein phosphatase PTEN